MGARFPGLGRCVLSQSAPCANRVRPESNSAELLGQRDREPASIGQVERFISADVDVGRIHRLAVVERPAQIEAATATLRQFS